MSVDVSLMMSVVVSVAVSLSVSVSVGVSLAVDPRHHAWAGKLRYNGEIGCLGGLERL